MNRLESIIVSNNNTLKLNILSLLNQLAGD